MARRIPYEAPRAPARKLSLKRIRLPVPSPRGETAAPFGQGISSEQRQPSGILATSRLVGDQSIVSFHLVALVKSLDNCTLSISDFSMTRPNGEISYIRNRVED